MDFKDKSVLVTGSTKHTGLGIARMFIERGAFVFINGRKDEDVQSAIKELDWIISGRAFAAPGDISKPSEVEAMFKAMDQVDRPIDILVNNACSLGLGYSFLDMPTDQFDRIIRVNLKGMFLCSQAAARRMKPRGRGAIVNVGSVTATRAIRGRFAYITSKGGIESATRAMALELGPLGIRVNCVLPGYIRTTRWDELDENTLAIRRANLPLGIEASYEDVAGAVLYLSSELAGNLTGAQLVVDGGGLIQAAPEKLDV
jgi:NAD(P)-dependent dehydrogenase (short-subunit alcohol dehydrogenase family)